MTKKPLRNKMLEFFRKNEHPCQVCGKMIGPFAGCYSCDILEIPAQKVTTEDIKEVFPDFKGKMK